CIAEKEIIAVRAVADRLRKALTAAGAFEVKGHAIERLTEAVLDENRGAGHSSPLKRHLVGKDVALILAEAGLSCPNGTRLAFFVADVDHPLVWTEQMMPVIPMIIVESAIEAIELAKRVERGNRHTAVMHSKNIEHLSRMARAMDCSIFVKNGPSFAGLGFGGEGFTTFTIASPTGEGLTSARTFTRERRCTLVDYFRIV
ncbi:aldehyde dehydrogenase EutE, partial [bacterium]|nr:aldehyde dehydrogenase EutE [bacterium]